MFDIYLSYYSLLKIAQYVVDSKLSTEQCTGVVCYETQICVYEN